MKKKVWFITGASKGLGLSLIKKLLQEGYRVAATSRKIENLVHEIHGQTEQFLPLQVDLEAATSIGDAIAKTKAYFGSIDVVVNNAGYGIGGAIEELTDTAIQQSFTVNVFATINVVKAVMPVLREQKSGHIINIASIAGFAAATGWAVYGATKFAIMGLSEVLAEDVKEFGIKVTVVAPGAFRTSFLEQDSLVIAADPIAAYTAVRASHNRFLLMSGHQAGDPEKAASVFIQLAENPEPPVRLFLGTDAYNRALQKLDLLTSELQQTKELSLSTDY